jgi:PII-like signaling protein
MDRPAGARAGPGRCNRPARHDGLHQVRTFRFDTLSEDLPIVVEIVDTSEKLEKFLELVEPQIQAGLVTLEKAQVRIYPSQT